MIDLRISSHALAVARIVFYASVAGELVGLYRWRRVSYLPEHWWVSDLVLPLAILAALLALAGCFAKPAIVATWALGWLALNVSRHQYHYDCMIEQFAFVFLFAPNRTALSVDAWRRREIAPALVPPWFALLLFAGLAAVYLGSLPFRFVSESWLTGAVVPLAATAPVFARFPLPDSLAVDWLLRASTYSGLAYEMLFPLVAVRRLRLPVALAGIAMHLGIAVMLPLPWFGLGLAGLVAAFLPWGIGDGVPAPEPLWRRRLGTALVATLALSQALVLVGSPRGPVDRLAGLYPHPIFWDWHFRLDRPILRYVADLDGRSIEIPSFDERGAPTVTNRYWTLTGFALRSTSDWEGRLSRYLRGHAAMLGAETLTVRIAWKAAPLPLDGDPERIRAARDAPWREAGVWRLDRGAESFTWTPEFLSVYGGAGSAGRVEYREREAAEPFILEGK